MTVVWDLKLIFSNTIKNWFIYEALFIYILQPTKKLSVAHDHVKLFLLGSYREFLVFSSNSGAVTNMHRTLKNGFHREQQYTAWFFHRKKNYSRKNKNCQNFLKILLNQSSAWQGVSLFDGRMHSARHSDFTKKLGKKNKVFQKLLLRDFEGLIVIIRSDAHRFITLPGMV